MTLIDLTITVKSRSSTSALLLTLLSLDGELAMRVALGIVLGDVYWVKVGHSVDDHRDVIHDNVATLIALKQKKLTRLFIIVGVNRSDGHLFIDAHIVKLGHELLVLDVRLEGRR